MIADSQDKVKDHFQHAYISPNRLVVCAQFRQVYFTAQAADRVSS